MKNKISVATALLSGLVGIGFATTIHVNAADSSMKPINQQWTAGPNVLPANAKMLVLMGDPQKRGMSTIRFKFPPNYKIPAHFHTGQEQITVISGDFHVGFGDQFNTANGTTYTAGSFVAIPAKAHHFAWTTRGAVIQITNMGPWNMSYIDKQADPRKQAQLQR